MGNEAEFDDEYYLAANPDVALAVKAGTFKTARHHYEQFGQAEGRAGCADEEGRAGQPVTKAHRRETLRFLDGSGLEIGALESPCPIPAHCDVTYCDRFTVEDARQLFPELSHTALQAPDRIIDLDRDGLQQFEAMSQDFVIFNHVIEHVANPINCLGELFRVVRPGGHLVIAAPDKRYTSDRLRALTGWTHLLREYRSKVTEVTPLHYFDIVALHHPRDILGGVDTIGERLRKLRDRHEHAHVWDTNSFRTFLYRAFDLLRIRTTRVYEITGDETRFEYFAIFEKFSEQARPASRASPAQSEQEPAT